MDLLLSIFIHEAKNLCTGLIGYARLLIETVDEQESERRKKYANGVILSAEKMVALIDFFEKYRCNCRRTSWQSLEDIYNRAKMSFSGVEVLPDEKMGGIKIFASDLISKVLENLIDNTIRHGKATKVKITYMFSSDEELVIFVGDNGVGVPKTDKEKIFEKGFGNNTGMGLYLAREILNITDITISENGEPGEGAQFEIRIPKNHYKLTI